jgi:hypothetical protein
MEYKKVCFWLKIKFEPIFFTGSLAVLLKGALVFKKEVCDAPSSRPQTNQISF